MRKGEEQPKGEKIKGGCVRGKTGEGEGVVKRGEAEAKSGGGGGRGGGKRGEGGGGEKRGGGGKGGGGGSNSVRGLVPLPSSSAADISFFPLSSSSAIGLGGERGVKGRPVVRLLQRPKEEGRERGGGRGGEGGGVFSSSAFTAPPPL